MTDTPHLDLSLDPVALTAVLVDIPSESHHEGDLADVVEVALRECGHLTVDRHGNTVVARTMLGREERVLLGGHLDTVPAHGNLPHRFEGDLLYGLGSCDMKGGVAVALSLAASIMEPVRDVTYVFYECEEVESRFNGLQRLVESHSRLLEADLAILMEPSNGVIEAGCQGTLRVEVVTRGRRAHSARAWLGDNAIHAAAAILDRLAAYEPRRPVIDGLEYREGLRLEIVRGDNRDKSGTNGDFLCIKGRYGFDFANHEERLTQPLIRKNGKLTPASWEDAFELVGKKFAEVREKDGGAAIGVIGSNRTVNEEAYLLSKFARTVLKTNNVDHHRTADFSAFAAAMRGKENATASMADVFTAPAMLLIGNDPTEQHPLLAWQIRNNVRLHRAKLYVINTESIKLRRQAANFTQIPTGTEGKVAAFLAGDDGAADALGNTKDAWNALREKIRGEQNIVIIFGSEIRGKDIASLVAFGSGIPGAKFICLGDYANSRGAADMGLYPDLIPGYHPATASSQFHEEWADIPQTAGLDLPGMVEAAKAGKLKALYVVGSNPVGRLDIDPFAFSKGFVVVQDMFLTETAAIADVVLPAANAYEKSGSMTNTCGDVQLVKKAGELSGTKPDFEMIVRIADAMGADVRKLVPFGGGVSADMGQSRGAQSGEADRHAVWLENQGLETKLSPLDPMAILDEIQRLVPGYGASRANLLAGNSEHTSLVNSGTGVVHKLESIQPANDTLFTSGTLGRYSRALRSVLESHEVKPAEVAAD